jgi:DNA primase
VLGGEHTVNRIVFPYIYGSFVVYFVARETPLTPQNDYEKGRKYKKMLTHNTKRRHISEHVKNDTLYNFEAIRGANEIILTEGVTDCISLANLGLKTISPVTKKYSQKEFEIIKTHIPKSKDIIIMNDNELNNEGSKSALKMAEELSLEGYQVKVIPIPLDEVRQKKRLLCEQLEEQNESND